MLGDSISESVYSVKGSLIKEEKIGDSQSDASKFISMSVSQISGKSSKSAAES